jgi:hypothetical protein
MWRSISILARIFSTISLLMWTVARAFNRGHAHHGLLLVDQLAPHQGSSPGRFLWG